jgi:hypothetical protein
MIAVLLVASRLVKGCSKSPEAQAKETKKLEAQLLEIASDPTSAEALKLSMQAAKLATQVAKLSEKDQGKYATAYAGIALGGDNKKETKTVSSGKSKGKVAPAEHFVYELNKAGDGVVITDYQADAPGGDLMIPGEIEGYPVVAIRVRGSNNFADLYHKIVITSIVLPDSITELYPYIIDVDARALFTDKLKSITLPKNLKNIPERLASNNRELTTIKWPEALESIGANAFSYAGITELFIPEGVKKIGAFAFYGCENLVSVTIPDSVEEIGNYAFGDCPVLATVTMPAHVIKYTLDGRASANAFEGCPKLTSIAQRKAITDTGYKGKF